jgi:hypothetical protein
MKFIVECLSKECLDVFFNTTNTTTTTICAQDRHDGQILAIALVAIAVTVGPLAIAGFVRHCALPLLFGGMSVEAQDRYRRWRESEEEAEKERLLGKINQRPPDAYP